MPLSHVHPADSELVGKSRGKRSRFIIFVVAILVVLILLPTPHTFIRSDLALSEPFLDILESGQIATHQLTGLRNNSRIIVRVSSTEFVTVVITSSQQVVYQESGKDHYCTFNTSSTSLSISIKNSGTGSAEGSAVVATDVEAYLDYVVQQWLPWWMSHS
jgi:hypothetical protein